jgi:nitroreductase
MKAPLENSSVLHIYLRMQDLIGAFNEDEVKKILKIPQDKKVVSLLTVWVPAESPAARPRKALEEIVAYNEYT